MGWYGLDLIWLRIGTRGDSNEPSGSIKVEEFMSS
jgi:hypothetical protein